MFRSNFDHPQGDIFSLLQLLKIKLSGLRQHACYTCLLCVYALPGLVQYSNNQTRKSINTKHNKYNRHATTNQIILSLVTEVKKKYLPEDGQCLTETCRRILRILKQYDHFNVLF
jgi:hypothetical protein